MIACTLRCHVSRFAHGTYCLVRQVEPSAPATRTPAAPHTSRQPSLGAHTGRVPPLGERCDALRATPREDATRLPHTPDAATITVRLSWAVLVVCVIAWPITSLTVFRGEPQGVLGLSWVALILSAANTILTAIVNRKTDGASDHGDTEVTDG